MANRPVYVMANVLKLRAKIMEDAEIAEYLDETPAGRDFRRLQLAVYKLLPKGVPLQQVCDSMQHLLGETFTRKELSRLAWRLAGNIRRLKNGKPVPPWRGQSVPEWVPIQIIKARYHKSRYNKTGAMFTARVLAGTPAGELFEFFWTGKYCGTFCEDFGFKRPRGDRPGHPYTDTKEFVGFRLFVEILPELQTLKFQRIEVSSGFFQWNRGLIVMRERHRDGFACPADYPQSVKCFQCPKGMDFCPAAVHPKSYRSGPCPNCNEDAWFDMDDPVICVSCRDHEIFTRKVEE